MRLALVSVGHSQQFQQFLSFFVGLGSCRNNDVHSLHLINLIVTDLWKDQLFPDAQGIVSPSIEGLSGDALEIPHPRKGGIDKAVEEFVHLLSPESDHASDG